MNIHLYISLYIPHTDGSIRCLPVCTVLFSDDNVSGVFDYWIHWGSILLCKACIFRCGLLYWTRPLLVGTQVAFLLSFFPLFFFFFWLSYMACVILVSRSGIKLTPPAVEVWSPNLLDHQGIPTEVAFCLLSIPYGLWWWLVLYPRRPAHRLGIAGSRAFCVWNDLATLTSMEVDLVFYFTSNEWGGADLPHPGGRLGVDNCSAEKWERGILEQFLFFLN